MFTSGDYHLRKGALDVLSFRCFGRDDEAIQNLVQNGHRCREIEAHELGTGGIERFAGAESDPGTGEEELKRRGR